MGKLNMGILGGFSGTVGTVIGSSNKKGDDIIRAKSQRVRTSFTEGQVNQQTKFALVTGFMQPLNFVLKNSFKAVAADEMTPYNYACKLALKEAVVGEAPDFELDYAKVYISKGKMSRETSSSAVLKDGKVTFSWMDDTGGSQVQADDKAMLIVYNVDKGEVSYSMGVVARSAETANVPLPYAEAGDNLLFYIFFQSATDASLFSTSKLIGTAVVA